MKKINLIVASMALLMSVTACNKKTTSTSVENSISTSANIESALTSLDSNSVVTSTTKISIPPYVPEAPTGAKLTPAQVLSLISYAPDKDIDYAKTATQTLEATGYDNGRKYNQTQITYATSYENNLTIANGTLQQYFYADESTIYSDEFDQVKILKDDTYSSMRVFKNKVFQDETERVNLLMMEDPNLILEGERFYRASATCGAGLDAYEQFMNAYQMGCSMGFASGKTTKGDTVYIRCEYESSEAQNQMVVYEFTYVFDSFNTGFMKEFVSDQRFYALDKYKELGDDGDELSLEPTYSAFTVTSVTPGVRNEFTGELPVDISSSFVSSVTVTASKNVIEIGDKLALRTECYPQTAINQEIYFTSEDESIAKVDYDGRVTGISAGKTRIVATNRDSGVSGYFEITVTEKSKIDAGDDSKKGDLKKALDACYDQVFRITKFAGGQSVDSIAGMGIDSSKSINAKKLASISVSSFAYDEDLRIATYVGSADIMYLVLPYEDNGNPNLSNNYINNRGNIFHDTFLGLEIYLKNDNTISYLKFYLRNDSIDPVNKFDFNELTNANIEEKLGAKFKANPYSRNLYYESAGFVYEE